MLAGSFKDTKCEDQKITSNTHKPSPGAGVLKGYTMLLSYMPDLPPPPVCEGELSSPPSPPFSELHNLVLSDCPLSSWKVKTGRDGEREGVLTRDFL